MNERKKEKKKNEYMKERSLPESAVCDVSVQRLSWEN